VSLWGMGQRQEALAPTQEAVTIYRQLVQANRDAYLPYLAMALGNLEAFLSEVGQRQQALAPAQEAISIYQTLAEANPDAYLPNLAMALNNLGVSLSEMGRHKGRRGCPARRWISVGPP
jgi:tetratricopeptide (TPR) repeat protein